MSTGQTGGSSHGAGYSADLTCTPTLEEESRYSFGLYRIAGETFQRLQKIDHNTPGVLDKFLEKWQTFFSEAESPRFAMEVTVDLWHGKEFRYSIVGNDRPGEDASQDTKQFIAEIWEDVGSKVRTETDSLCR